MLVRYDIGKIWYHQAIDVDYYSSGLCDWEDSDELKPTLIASMVQRYVALSDHGDDDEHGDAKMSMNDASRMMRVVMLLASRQDTSTPVILIRYRRY